MTYDSFCGHGLKIGQVKFCSTSMIPVTRYQIQIFTCWENILHVLIKKRKKVLTDIQNSEIPKGKFKVISLFDEKLIWSLGLW